MFNTEEEFYDYAIKNYDNPSAKTIEEFENDLLKVNNIKRLLCREYHPARLAINHIIVFYNVFKHNAGTVILFSKTYPETWPKLKTYLLYLNLMPEAIPELNIISSDIEIDYKIIEELREI